MKMENNDINWYELWMQHAQDFFSTAEKNLKDIFEKNKFVNPEEHTEQIKRWVETLKKQWDVFQINSESPAYQYWKMMIKMSNQACDLMVEKWIKRSQDNNPVSTIRELYDLWLNSCQEIYQKSVQSKSYQDTYADFMNAAFKFWNNTTNDR